MEIQCYSTKEWNYNWLEVLPQLNHSKLRPLDNRVFVAEIFDRYG